MWGFVEILIAMSKCASILSKKLWINNSQFDVHMTREYKKKERDIRKIEILSKDIVKNKPIFSRNQQILEKISV